MSDELKPCPFCGGKRPQARKLPPVRDQQVDAWMVDCSRLKCLAAGPLAEGSREAAITAWNTRVIVRSGLDPAKEK